MIRWLTTNRAVIAAEILLIAGLVVFLFVGHSLLRRTPAKPPEVVPQQKSSYSSPTILTRLKDERISESSGLVASRNNPGKYWTHNDSGDGPFIYAFDETGEGLGVWRAQGAENEDWEDIAIGPGPVAGTNYIYVGDIGDNNSSRSQVVIYRFAEPTIAADDRESTKSKPIVIESVEAYRFRYPDGRHDAEALLVHPNGNIYVLSKVAFANPVVYEASPPFDSTKVGTFKSLGEIKLPSLFGGVITGGDISPDGRRVALCDLFQGYEILLPDSSNSFDDIWKQKIVGFDLGKRKQGESIAYRLDGKSVLASSEGKHPEVFQVLISASQPKM